MATPKTMPVSLNNDLDSLPLMDIDPDLLRNVEIISIEAGQRFPTVAHSAPVIQYGPESPALNLPSDLCTKRCGISRQHLEIYLSVMNTMIFWRIGRHLSVLLSIKLDLEIKYGITTRINHITTEVLELLAASGCVSVFIGIETGSPELQISSAKYLHVDDILPRIKTILESGIHVSTNFIVGFPDENWADLYSSIELMLAVCWLGATMQH